VENDDAIVTNGFRRLIQSISINNGPLIILAAVPRLHLLSERVLSLFSYTLSIPVRILIIEIETFLFIFKTISIEIRKEWLRKRFLNIPIAEDFNYDLILAQTKSLLIFS